MMVSLLVKGFVSDMGYMEIWEDTYEVDVEEGSDIEEVLFEFLRTERECGEEVINEIKDRLETGSWFGGEWKKEGSRVITWVSDATGERFSI